MIHILFFGQLADIAEQTLGSSELDFELTSGQDKTSLVDLRNSLTKNSPNLATELNKPSNLCAVNQEMCTDSANTVVNDGDEVAFMSPLSGG